MENIYVRKSYLLSEIRLVPYSFMFSMSMRITMIQVKITLYLSLFNLFNVLNYFWPHITGSEIAIKVYIYNLSLLTSRD